MPIGRKGIVLAIAAVAMLFEAPVVDVRPNGSIRLSLEISQAEAAPRHVTRRVARRTTRRTVARLTALPSGCMLSGLYWYCGGVYYQEVVEGGSTVYIVVTP